MYFVLGYASLRIVGLNSADARLPYCIATAGLPRSVLGTHESVELHSCRRGIVSGALRPPGCTAPAVSLFDYRPPFETWVAP